MGLEHIGYLLADRNDLCKILIQVCGAECTEVNSHNPTPGTKKLKTLDLAYKMFQSTKSFI